jgi:hypothetical protein
MMPGNQFISGQLAAGLEQLRDKRALRLRRWGVMLVAALAAVACVGFSSKGSSPGTLLALDAETGACRRRAATQRPHH